MEPSRLKLKYYYVLILLTGIAQGNKTEGLDPVRDQIVLYKQRTQGRTTLMTTSNGQPVEFRDTSTLNKKLLYNNYFMDSLTHSTRERIPQRVVHGKGAGAFGYFEVTQNVTEFIKADFLSEIGKKTKVAVRFSHAIVERGGTDTFRGPRGFSVKFYTKTGNFDIAGFSSTKFVIKDPIYFTTFLRIQLRNPATNIHDVNMFWDFLTRHPETFSIFLNILGDEGIPKGYRHMSGHSIHTYQIQNQNGKIYFARFHFTPDIGKYHITSEEAANLDASDPDCFTRDLYEAISCGMNVSWTLSWQLLTLEQAMNAEIDVFDITLELPEDEYPLIPIGRLVLDRNPVNYFAEIEQLAYCPCNLVPGIDGGLDKTFESRCLAYRDAHIYRLGVNFNKIKVNCPFEAHTYNRDGQAPVGDNEGDAPNYYENSFNGPMPYHDHNRSSLIEIHENKPNNLWQATRTYKKMSAAEKKRLIGNIINKLGPAISWLQEKAIAIFNEIDPDLGNRVELGLKMYNKEPACSEIFS